MCGRTCLTLNPDEIICACKYESLYQGKCIRKAADEHKVTKLDAKEEKPEKLEKQIITPSWRAEYNCGRTYTPSYNMAPTDICPVLVSAAHFDVSNEEKPNAHERLIVPMMWGMIPFWHKGDYRKHGLTTNNCRFEHMLESKLYHGPFQRGQRCVLLCEGFYEWQTTKSAKPSQRAAYYLHMPQQDGVDLHDKATWTADNVRLLKLAGLYDIWENEDGDKMFSFSIITFEATKLTSWLHHRMPAILETEEQIDGWLDFKRVPAQEAIKLIRPATQLAWHRVASIVNNSRNKSEQCNKPYELGKAMPVNKIMDSWLNMRKRREEKTNKRSSSETDDEVEQNHSGTASESDNGEQASKRLRFRDFKKSTCNKSMDKLE